MSTPGSNLLGTWQYPSTTESHEADWIHFAGSGVVIWGIHDPGLPNGRLTNRLFFSIESQTTLRIRPRQRDEGWTVDYGWEGERLIILRNGQRWICSRAGHAKAPEWFQLAMTEATA